MRNYLTALFLQAVLAAFCLPAQAVTLTVAMGGDPDSLDPHKSTLIYARLVQQQLFLPLTVIGADGEVAPGAAAGWTVSEDGLTYTFTLRGDIAWSDGRAMSAEDWVRSFRRVLAPETLYPGAELLYWIEGAQSYNTGKAGPEALAVTAPDAATLVIRLTDPNPFFLTLTATVDPVPSHIIAAEGAAWAQAGHLVGNGPYRLKSRIPNNKIVLELNTDSPLAAGAGYDEIVFLPIDDQAAATRRFLAGELDIAYSVPPNEFDRLKAKRPEAAIAFPAMRNSYITFNTRVAPTSSPKVRAALSMLIDRDLIAKKIVGGAARAEYQLVEVGLAGIGQRQRPAWADWPRGKRKAEAERLLAEAGYGPDNPLRVSFVYTGALRQRIAITLQSLWRDAGIETELLSKEVQGLFAALDAGDYQIGILAYDMGVDPDPYGVLAGFAPGGWADRSGYRAPGFEDRLAAARKLADADARAGELAAAESLFLAASPVAPLYTERAMWFISPRVAGWTADIQPFYFHHLRPGGG